MARKRGAIPSSQYRDSRNLAARGRLHARYGNVGWFAWVADRLGLANDSRVLDVGCGAGWFWGKTAQRMPESMLLHLSDLSQGMVAEAVERVSKTDRFSQVNGLQADAESLPFRDTSFDAVVAMHVLYHVPEPKKAISEMKRVLRAGGKLIVTTNGPRNLGALFDLWSRTFGGPNTDPAALVFGFDQARSALGAYFEHVDLACFNDVYAVTDADDIFAYLTSMPPGIDASPERKNKLRMAIEQALAEGDGTLGVEREAGMLTAVAA